MHHDAAVTPSDEAQHAAELLELGDAFFELDREWRIVRLNGRQEQLSRRPRAESLGRVFGEVWPELATSDSRCGREYRRCMEQRVPVQFEEHHRPDLWTGVTAYPVSGGGIAVFSRDITRAKLAEMEAIRRAAEVEAILGSVAEGVLVYDADGGILRANAAAESILQYSAGERRLPLSDRLSLRDIGWLREDGSRLEWDDMPAVRAARHGEIHLGVVLRMRRDGAERWLTVTAAPLVSAGSRAGAVVSIADITEKKRNEQALRESETRFRLLAEAMPQIVCVLRADGTAEYVNPTWVRISGKDLAATRADGWIGVVHPDDLPAARACRVGALKLQAPQEAELRYRCADGSFRWFLSRLAPVVEDGRVVRLVGAAMDIEDRKRAEQALRDSEAKHRALFENLPDAVLLTVPDGKIVAASPAACAMFGLTEAEIVRRGREALIDHDDPRHAAFSEERRRTGRAAGWELTFVRENGERFPAETSSVVLHGGRSAFLVLRDVTERKRADEALRDANERLRDADRRKDEFLGMLSHELRNPLAPIRNALYILDHAAPTGEQARRAKQVANRQIAHITRLVDDLLDVTRIARGKIELQRTELDLSAVARRTADDYRSVMAERGLQLQLEVPVGRVGVDGDETRLAQVLGNLLSNAAKFTPAGGRVTLAVREQADRAIVHVSDTGSGIASEVLPTIFEPFTQGKQTLARSEGGLGLGLALVKGLVTLHGGEVTAESAGADRGTDFVVSLPLARSPASRGAEADRAAAVAPAPRRRVLVVDDNRDAADTLAQLVEMLGHEPVVAYDAFEALRACSEELPDVILCDIGLPGMDGYELARQLRALSSHARLRLVALTGYAQPEDVARAAEVGFDAHVAKPPDPATLARLVGGDPRDERPRAS